MTNFSAEDLGTESDLEQVKSMQKEETTHLLDKVSILVFEPNKAQWDEMDSHFRKVCLEAYFISDNTEASNMEIEHQF